MTEKKSTDQRIIEFLGSEGTGTVDQICTGLKIGRTSARKYLAGLTVDKKIVRERGGRDGHSKLPDIFSLPGKKSAKRSSKAGSGKAKQDRLKPGELDGLVLGYMRRHKGDLPLSPTRIAKAIERSPGAVKNCLDRLVTAKKARLANKAPREYDLQKVKSR